MWKFLINFFVLSFIFHPLFAGNVDWIKCEKEYVSPSQIMICEDGLFININNYCIKVKSIEYDENGTFFSKIDDKTNLQWNWTCPNCGTKNSPFRKHCRDCGYRW